MQVKRIYESYKLNCHKLPESLLKYNKFYLGKGDYEEKHPNTGVCQ